jgi:uncharacterized protein (TIGR03086 family)
MSETREQYRRATEYFGAQVAEIGDEQFTSPTPCAEWDVRALLNHVVNETLWMPPLLGGKSIDEVGDRFDGDVLGDDPQASWASAKRAATEAVNQDGAMELTVHLSFGDVPGEEYTFQMTMDALVHGWDLAKGIGGDTKLDPEIAEACYERMQPMAEEWRAAGAFGESVSVPVDADAQTRLLAMLGRNP